MWEKESCYARLILQLYLSIDSIHVHNKLYSGIYLFIMDIDLKSFQKGDHYLFHQFSPLSPHFTTFHTLHPISPHFTPLSPPSPHFTTFIPFHHFHPFTHFTPSHRFSPMGWMGWNGVNGVKVVNGNQHSWPSPRVPMVSRWMGERGEWGEMGWTGWNGVKRATHWQKLMYNCHNWHFLTLAVLIANLTGWKLIYAA